jgi:alpha-1,3-rhamnosyl/mannosyltransferase
VVLTLHDVIPLALSGFYFHRHEDEGGYRQRVQRDLDRADVVLTDSECSKRDILSHFRVETNPVVIHPANLLPTSPAPPCDLRWVKDGYFLYLGGYERRKGLDDLLAVYRHLHFGGQIPIPLVLVGERHFVSEALENAIAVGQTEGSIIEAGYLTDPELAWMLQNARGLVYPSLYEGFGYPPLEAMAQGCPVLTTRVSSMPEVCGSAALYVTPGDRRELAEAILELNRNQALRTELSAAGRARAAQFSWERSAAKYLEILDLRLDQRKRLRTTSETGT